jgi:hypothetical protein
MSRRHDREGETSATLTERTGIRDRAKEFISSKNPLQRGSNCRIALVSPDDVHVIWPSILEYVEEVVSHSQGEMTSENFYEELTNGSMQLWVSIEGKEVLACMITQIAPYPNKQVLRIIALGGVEMDKWIQFLPDIEHWAMGIGCTALEAWGRKGWLRILQDWKCSYHILTKDLTARMH